MSASIPVESRASTLVLPPTAKMLAVNSSISFSDNEVLGIKMHHDNKAANGYQVCFFGDGQISCSGSHHRTDKILPRLMPQSRTFPWQRREYNWSTSSSLRSRNLCWASFVSNPTSIAWLPELCMTFHDILSYPCNFATTIVSPSPPIFFGHHGPSKSKRENLQEGFVSAGFTASTLTSFFEDGTCFGGGTFLLISCAGWNNTPPSWPTIFYIYRARCHPGQRVPLSTASLCELSH